MWISLNTPREVRHTIANHLYQDVDVKNAHPVILAFLCKQRKIPCPLLEEYINNRDEKLALISTNKEIAKSVVLSTLNGGVSAMKQLEHPPYWSFVCFKQNVITFIVNSKALKRKNKHAGTPITLK